MRHIEKIRNMPSWNKTEKKTSGKRSGWKEAEGKVSEQKWEDRLYENLSQTVERNQQINQSQPVNGQKMSDCGQKTSKSSRIHMDYGETVVLSAGTVSGPASLVSKEPGELATIYLNEDLTVIGKLETACDAVISLPTVSRIHAKIRKKEENYFLSDMNSRNGTWVNEQELYGELKKAPVTVLLILANILVFTAVEFTGGSEDTMHMLQCGAAYTPAIMQGEYYRIFTSMFLHFGPQHLGNNMLVLFVLGGRLERTVGKLKYLLIYLLGGMGGNLLCLFLELDSADFVVSAGASGAVFAVMGAMIYAVIRGRGHIEDLSARQVVIMAAFSLYFGFISEGVDNAAHVGGLICGFLLAVLLYHPSQRAG